MELNQFSVKIIITIVKYQVQTLILYAVNKVVKMMNYYE